MRLAVLIAVFSLISVSAQAEEAAMSRELVRAGESTSSATTSGAAMKTCTSSCQTTPRTTDELFNGAPLYWWQALPGVVASFW